MAKRTDYSSSSLKYRAFLMFLMDFRPAEVANTLRMKKTTAFRYFEQWKKLPGDYYIRKELANKIWRRLSKKDKKIIADVLSEELGTSNADVLERMQKPWALRQLITGEWRNWNLPIHEKKQPSRLSRFVSQMINRKSHEAELLLYLILNKEPYYLEMDDEEEGENA